MALKQPKEQIKIMTISFTVQYKGNKNATAIKDLKQELQKNTWQENPTISNLPHQNGFPAYHRVEP